MSYVIRCMRCYARVEYDEQPHLNAWGRPCNPTELTWIVLPFFGFLAVALMVYAAMLSSFTAILYALAWAAMLVALALIWIGVVLEFRYWRDRWLMK